MKNIFEKKNSENFDLPPKVSKIYFPISIKITPEFLLENGTPRRARVASSRTQRQSLNVPETHPENDGDFCLMQCGGTSISQNTSSYTTSILHREFFGNSIFQEGYRELYDFDFAKKNRRCIGDPVASRILNSSELYFNMNEAFYILVTCWDFLVSEFSNTAGMESRNNWFLGPFVRHLNFRYAGVEARNYRFLGLFG